MNNTLFFDENNQSKIILLRIYSTFRVISAAILFILSIFNLLDDKFNSSSLVAISLIYLLTCIAQATYNIFKKYHINPIYTFLSLLIDQIFIFYLIFLVSHQENNFDILLLTPVSMAAILFRGSPATFFAASATIGLFLAHFYGTLFHNPTTFNTVRFSLFGFIFFSASGCIQYLSSRLRDAQSTAEISQKQAIELSLINSEIVHRIRTGILIFDKNNQIILSNQSAQQALEQHISSKYEQHINTIINGLRLWREKKQSHLIIHNSHCDIRCSFSSLSQGGHTIVFIDDLSEIAQQAQQLKLASLGGLTAGIAHEIRNPLSAISYANQLLLSSFEHTALSNEDQELISTSETNVNRINAIINDILSLSRESTGIPDKINILEFCHKLKADYLLSNPEATIEIKTSDNISTIAPVHQGQLRQIFVNLIDNGLRHSSMLTQKASICISLTQANNDCLEISFTDQGNGVPETNTANLFEPFFTTDKQGTGLGLYLAKELCTLNQANLSYTGNQITKKEDGATFTIRFPHLNRDILLQTSSNKT